MNRKPPLSVDCPTCGRQVPWTEAYPVRPFCSERCKLIDLGAWADESYRVPTEQPLDWPDETSAPGTLQ